MTHLVPLSSARRFLGGRAFAPALRRRRARFAGLAAAAVALAVAAAGPPSAVATAPAPVIPPAGASYDVLAVQWWQYVLAQPAATNPLLDATGADCAAGQAGPVFFLAGSLSSDPVQRTACVVRGPRALFFPLLNSIDVHVPTDDQTTPELIYADFVNNVAFRADSLHASVDGNAVPGLDPTTGRFRACAAPVAGCFPQSFAVRVPDGNLFGLPAGTYGPAVQDGFYLLLAPLAPGVHTISFGGAGFAGGAFSQDITYRLRVTR
jgi:hypothetical protein